MEATDVISIYEMCRKKGLIIWIDGGWGVDALLGYQSRPHKDLDIAIQEKDVSKLRELFQGKGYGEIKLEIARPHNVTNSIKWPLRPTNAFFGNILNTFLGSDTIKGSAIDQETPLLQDGLFSKLEVYFSIHTQCLDTAPVLIFVSYVAHVTSYAGSTYIAEASHSCS